jgi:hypothetical protein
VVAGLPSKKETKKETGENKKDNRKEEKRRSSMNREPTAQSPRQQQSLGPEHDDSHSLVGWLVG